MSEREHGLGRRLPEDWDHISLYPVRALATLPERRPVVFGWNWYSRFYDPVEKDGAFWIGLPGDWGGIVGGHAITGVPRGVKDRTSWHEHYDQGREGACAGFAGSRERSLIERRMFDGFDLYRRAQLRDGIPMPHQGTTLRAMGEALRHEGPTRKGDDESDARYRVPEYRWATDWDEVRRILAIPATQGWVPLANSWGDSWPKTVKLPDEAGMRLLREDGEAMVLMDAKGVLA